MKSFIFVCMLMYFEFNLAIYVGQPDVNFAPSYLSVADASCFFHEVSGPKSSWDYTMHIWNYATIQSADQAIHNYPGSAERCHGHMGWAIINIYTPAKWRS